MQQNLIRCPWCGTTDQLYIDYHDHEWGVPVHDDRVLFEFLTLEWAQAWLSWITVLRKRENYRRLFHNWDIEKIARMTDAELENILLDAGVVRNRLKVYSVRKNALVVLELKREFGSLDAYFWSNEWENSPPYRGSQRGYLDNTPPNLPYKGRNQTINHGLTITDFPTEDDISQTISKDLKKRGMSFVGSTIIYAFMQAVGMVDDHIDTCFRKK